MKILVATEHWFPDVAAGGARLAEQTSRALAERGHEVTVIAPRASGCGARDHADGLNIRRVLRRDVLPKTYTGAARVARAVRALDISEPDVVLAHHPTSVVGIARAALGVPISYVFHASPLRETRYRRATGVGIVERARSRAVEPGLARLERAAAQRARQILVLSDFSRELLLEDHPACADRVQVVGAGVDTRRFHPAPDRDAVRARLGIAPAQSLLLTVRRLVHRMGIGVLLDALAEPGLAGRGVRLVVVGEGELRSRLERQRDALGLRGSVSFLGHLPDESVLDWYRAADLFVLPTVAYEGFGLSTVEALACGTPVVGTAVGATTEILGSLDPSLVAERAEPSSLAVTLARALDRGHTDLRSRCRTFAEETFSWDVTIPKWEHALESIRP